MKRIFVMAVIGVVASAGLALADNDIGCGLGTQVWEGKSGLLPKVLGATTNGTLGNQTFGISTGTLGCKQEGVITAEARTAMFAGANIDRLAREMAAGQGETLDTLASLIGIADADKPAFFHLTKSNFGEIFFSDRVSAGEMLGTINRLMATSPQLAQYSTI